MGVHVICSQGGVYVGGGGGGEGRIINNTRNCLIFKRVKLHVLTLRAKKTHEAIPYEKVGNTPIVV